MYHNNMTDVEFCALTAILLFDPSKNLYQLSFTIYHFDCSKSLFLVASGLTEVGSRIVREARDRVYNDWFGFYDKNGVHDIGQRVGNTMLLLPAVQVRTHIVSFSMTSIIFFDTLYSTKKCITKVHLHQ